MLYLRSESVGGNIQYVNADRITGFKYNKEQDVTTMFTTDNIRWSMKGDATSRIVSALRKSGNLAIIPLGEKE